MSTDEMICRLKETLAPARFRHTLGVAQEAVRMAPILGVDKEKAYVAALLHDCAKNFTQEQVDEYCEKYGVKLDLYCATEKALIHAFMGSLVAEVDYGVEDEDILNAIYYHTTAKADMTPLEKLIYIADMTEPGRTMEAAEEVRRLAEEDMDEALIYAIGSSIKHVIQKGGLIHPDSIFARNYLIMNRRQSK